VTSGSFFDGAVVDVVVGRNGQLAAAAGRRVSRPPPPPPAIMFALHEPLHGRTTSSKHLKDEPLLSHPHHHQIHPISFRNWMQSSIADQPKSVSRLLYIFPYIFFKISKQLH